MTKKKVVVTKWLCAGFSLLAFQLFIVPIVILSDLSHPHLLGRVIIADSIYQISVLLKYMVAATATGIPICYAFHVIETRERIQREAVHQQDNSENDVSVWPPAPRIDRQ